MFKVVLRYEKGGGGHLGEPGRHDGADPETGEEEEEAGEGLASEDPPVGHQRGQR